MHGVTALVVLAVGALAQRGDSVRWQREARRVTIIRDDWGIAHVYGKTDADAVFGMEYAQAEDDFNRIETNYLNALGRLAEAEGPSAIYADLRMRLFIDPDSLRAHYRRSPPWLKRLMNAFADGLNFYLSTHPAVQPRVIRRFEPWMALAFTEGSIGGDMERISVTDLAAFYGGAPAGAVPARGDGSFVEPGGSNGIAIAPRLTRDHHALLWINPHTSFYFRSELQMASDEGLDAYGAVTWGQFFVYQGFNQRCGGMHTSSGGGNIDEFLQATRQRPGSYYYRRGQRELPVVARTITAAYPTDSGTVRRPVTACYTPPRPRPPEIRQRPGGGSPPRTTAPGRRPVPTAPGARPNPATAKPAPRKRRAATTPCGCSRAPRPGRWTRSWPRGSTLPPPPSSAWSRGSSRPTIACRPPTRSGRGSPTRPQSCVSGTSAGERARWPRPWPGSWARTSWGGSRTRV